VKSVRQSVCYRYSRLGSTCSARGIFKSAAASAVIVGVNMGATDEILPCFDASLGLMT
jgi:hypothetical protein